MAVAEDLTKLEHQLKELITRYEQYFVGLEKREPLPLLADVEKMARRYANVPINNTMYKHKYTMLVARLNTYREHWNRILRLIEDGKYSRDRFIRDLHLRQRAKVVHTREEHVQHPHHDTELDRIFYELRDARKACHLPVEKLSRELVATTIEKSKAALIARLGSADLVFRVVVEDGKPKIKASLRK
ncbi:MAG: hypothetical protein H7X83_07470 [Verrucomicrobia bacterium]|nr:hypothetical protein [Deltaproteobacteria bacterium]